MAGSFALSMRREAAIVNGGSNNAQAMAVAESGLAVAELMLLNSDPLQRWSTDGSVYQLDYTDAKVRIRLLAETGKIDINTADQVLLQGVLASAPLEEDEQAKLVDAILDWRDADDLVRLQGAEKDEYKKAGLSYKPRNKPFQSIEELQLVLGMNEETFKWLENLITVNSGLPKVDLTQATKEVLQVLPGVDAGLINSYIAAKLESIKNGLPAPTFDVFGASQAGTTLTPAIPVAPVAAGLEQNITVTVIAEALLNDGTTAIIKALIKKSDGTGSSPFQALKWQRNAIGEGSLFTDEKEELLVRQYAEPEFNN
jgi:general secretion pathway protein K